jgi:hypothetical protein
MTKEMDEFFNLPAMAEEETVLPTAYIPPTDDSLGVRECEHDSEMNDIHQRALTIHDDIAKVARSTDPSRVARLFEVSAQYLKAAMDASNSKVDRQLKMAKLKIEAQRMKVDDDNIRSLGKGREIVADRNEMIRLLLQNSENEILDVDVDNETTKK